MDEHGRHVSCPRGGKAIVLKKLIARYSDSVFCAAPLFTGSIPPELGSLSQLRLLKLYRNQLSGESHIHITLWYLQLSGRIPPTHW